MKKILTDTIKYIIVFALCAAILFALLIMSALVPRSQIKENMLSSVGFFSAQPLFYDRVSNAAASRVDNYADCITTSIAWGFDGNAPFESTMRASFYSDGIRNVNDCLLEGITNGIDPYTEYMRYWHGSAAVIRIMHLFTDISGIRVCAAVLVFGFIAALAAILILKKRYAEAVCSVLALASVSVWFAADCMQNVWCVIIMLIASIVCALFTLNKKYEKVCTMLLVSGIVTNFFDFLTAETMTLLFPLILSLSIKRSKGGSLKEDILWAARCCFLWLCGYGLMWGLKWLLAGQILGINVLPFVTGHISERLDDRGSMALLPYLWETLMRNIGCLFPLGYAETGLILGVIVVIGLCFYGFVFRREGCDRAAVLMFLLLGAVVYARYLVLHNHSYGHYFFTYRAQVSSALAVLLSLAELTGTRVERAEKTAPVKTSQKRRRKNGQKT